MDGAASLVVDMQDQSVGGAGGGDVVLMDHHPLIMTSPSSSHAKEEEKSRVVKFLIEQKLQKVSSWPSDYGMYRVPKALMMNENPEAYIPHMVSIGPFYYGQQHLRPMESRKLSYFKKFMDRKPTLFDFYVEPMTTLEERAYKCYLDDDVNIIERKKFVMMLVVDGCFILEELLLLHCKEDKGHKTSSDVKWKWNHLVKEDLLLLENQIPIFVLEALYKVFIDGDDDDSQEAAAAAGETWTHYGLMFNYLLLPMIHLNRKEKINYSYHEIQQLEPAAAADKPQHLLDFVRKSLIQPEVPDIFMPETYNCGEMNQNNKSCSLDFVPAECGLFCLGLGDVPLDQEDPIPLLMKDETMARPIRCATELEKASVEFKKASMKFRNKKKLPGFPGFPAIKFDHNKGELTIPGIVIGLRDEILLRNIIAYEQYTNDHSYLRVCNFHE